MVDRTVDKRPRLTYTMPPATVTAVFVIFGICSSFPVVQSLWSVDNVLSRLIKREVTFGDKDTNQSQVYTHSNETWKEVLLLKFKETDWYKDGKVTEPVYCFDERDNNNTTYGYFFCPRANEKSDKPECCGSTNRQTCCQEDEEEEDTGLTDDIYTVITVAAAFTVSISLCLVLYCCCCQRRPELHSGKLVWIRKSKEKNITVTEDGMDSGDQGETELIGFTEKTCDDAKPNSHNGDTTGFASPTKTHVSASGQTMTVPLINIQASTPDA